MVSAIHGLNITELLDEIVKKIKDLGIKVEPEDKEYFADKNYRNDDDNFEDFEESAGGNNIESEEDGISGIAILGQPNSGKSTLFNKILDEDRVIVDDVEGTTRDSIDSTVTVNGKHYRFIDTAGLKKNKLKEQDLEFYSKIRTYRSIEKSQICLLLIDSTKQITNQDQKIVELCLQKGCSVCIIFNKTDAVSGEKLESLINYLNTMLAYIDYLPFLTMSALKDKNTDELFRMIDYLLEERHKKITENKLMQLFKDIDNERAVYIKGKKFKIKFIRQIKTSPPGFLVFSNMEVKKKNNIIKFIENSIRDEFGFTGTPLFFKFKH
ncbi:MAG: GTP-binding protein [Actinobacteria bacterium]|nr:GTP-binding protein [Actinomycetota bacterium]